MDFFEHDPTPQEVRESAARRLRVAIDRTERRRRYVWRTAFVTGVSAVLTVTLAVGTPAPRPDLVPLLGLASAVEGMSTPPTGAMFSSTAERFDLLEVPVGSDGHAIRVQVNSSLQLRMTPDGQVRRTTEIGAPVLVPDADTTDPSIPQPDPEVAEAIEAEINHRAEVGAGLGLAGDYWPATEGEMLAAMRRHVAGSEDGRSEEARMLALAASLIMTNPAEPDRRSDVLRAVAQIPGLDIVTGERTLELSLAFMDGDLPLRLAYILDASTGDVVGERLELLDPSGPTVLSSAEFTPWEIVTPDAVS